MHPFHVNYILIDGKPPLIVASRKCYSEYTNRGRKIQTWGNERPPIYRSWNGHVTDFSNYGNCSG